MGEVIGLLWPIIGLLLHIRTSYKMKTWCGTPIWKEPTTYMLALPAMIMGPIVLIVDYLEPPKGD